jgi:DNA-3-methyladenine glycosylase
MGKRLLRPFFERYTPRVARDLLGTSLVRVQDGRRICGMIVETEAYRGRRDPASHAFKGKSKRNEVMFGEAGHSYVYFTYGFHHCINITTEPSGTPGAVLIRALAPMEGFAQMSQNRGVKRIDKLTSGPGMLTKALGIDRSLNGEDIVTSRRLFIEAGRRPGRIGITTRVGIKEGSQYKWRYFIVGNRFVSKGHPSRPQNP